MIRTLRAIVAFPLGILVIVLYGAMVAIAAVALAIEGDQR